MANNAKKIKPGTGGQENKENMAPALEVRMNHEKRNSRRHASTGSALLRTSAALKRIGSMLAFISVLLFHCAGYAQTDPEALFAEGISSYKEGNYQKAVDLFTELIIIAPNSAKALKNRGVALMNLGMMDEAISDFRKAIDIAPKLHGIYVNLGAAWHYKGAYDKAVAAYTQAITEEPSRALTYYNRGISKMFLNDLPGAISDFEKTLALDPALDAPVYARQEARKRLAAKTGKTYSVQTGAFLVETNAMEHLKKLIEKGIDARIVLFKDAEKKTWHLVRSGKGLSLEAAKQFRGELEAVYGIEAIIRPEHAL
jgi:tetratricopeptide (TPR) repeat protein